MIKKTNISHAFFVVFFGTIAVASMLSSCNHISTCDGKRCREALGFEEEEKPSERDSIFVKNHPLNASKFNVFVESSISMDGYVSEDNTEFKTTLHRLIGQVVADVVKNDTSVSFNYINSEIKPSHDNKKRFARAMTPGSFSEAGGDRKNSDIIDVISQVVTATPSGEVSMFVSDCVYSPQSSSDLDKALKMQQTDMLNILKNKSKSDSDFGVLLYRLVSDFNGNYYTKTNAHVMCDKGRRPYFVWFVGNESLLASVVKCVSAIMMENKAQTLIGIPPYSYLPYKTIKSNHPYHYLSAKTKSDSLFTFSFVANMSYLPLDMKYILDKKNYECAKDKYFIKKIEPYSDSDDRKYNVKYTVGVRGQKNSFITPTLVEISLKSMLANTPAWVSKFDDPKGTDYDSGYDPSKLRTFGLSSLVDGISEFYKSPYYVTFKIKVN